jgi:hypothetical protein
MGCASWSRKFPGEWVCAPHWRMFDPRARRALRKIWRLKEGGLEYRQWGRLNRVERRIWKREKARALERSAGL